LGSGFAALQPFESNAPTTLLQAFLGRACCVDTDDEATLQIVRHVGWITSLLLASVVNVISSKGSHCQPAAWITCLEAVSIDLLGFFPPAARGTLFCPNFGIVFINSNWVEMEGGSKALEMLQKMIYVTIIRGAQSGGVLAWNCSKVCDRSPKATRCRVVNRKRSDLSKRILQKVKGDLAPFGYLRKGINAFYGHTRFATSAQTNLNGAHPHRWSPPQRRRVYSMTDNDNNSPDEIKPQVVVVENYITHNGDFDFC
jgi:hypothetical protein